MDVKERLLKFLFNWGRVLLLPLIFTNIGSLNKFHLEGSKKESRGKTLLVNFIRFK